MLVEYQQASVADMDDQRLRVPVRGSGADDISVLRGHCGHDTAEEP